MKHLIIVGAGGMGRSMYLHAQNCIGYGTIFDVKGFLEIDKNMLDNFEGYPPIIGDENTYHICKDDVFIWYIGHGNLRYKVVSKLREKNAEFFTLIHNTAIVLPTAIIGKGCFVQPYVVIGADAVVGDHCQIQNHTDIGHDCVLGAFNRIDCKVMCVGGVKVGNFVTVHSSAVINHKVVLGDHSVVGASSFVISKVKEGTTVFGSPAKKLSL